MPVAAVLYPVLALIAWTFVMWAWMYATRIPAIQRADIDMEELSRTGGSLDMPPAVARVADNYNHLDEEPTIFYALALIIRGMFISWRLRKQARHMATFTKAGLTKREEYDEVSRRG